MNGRLTSRLFEALKLPIFFKDGVLFQLRTLLKMKPFFFNMVPCDSLVEPSARIYSCLAIDYTKCRNQITSPFGFHADHGGFFAIQRKTQRSVFETSSARSADRNSSFPHRNTSGKMCFRRTRFSMVPGLPMSFDTNGPRIRVPHIYKPPGNPISVKSRCIGCLATILIRGKRTPDSSSPCL